MFAEHRCSGEAVVRSGLRSAKGGVLFVIAKFWHSETLCVVLRASVSLALYDTFCPGRQKVSKKRPCMLLRRIPATWLALLLLFVLVDKKYPKNALMCCFAGFRRLDSQNFSRR